MTVLPIFKITLRALAIHGSIVATAYQDEARFCSLHTSHFLSFGQGQTQTVGGAWNTALVIEKTNMLRGLDCDRVFIQKQQEVI